VEINHNGHVTRLQQSRSHQHKDTTSYQQRDVKDKLECLHVPALLVPWKLTSTCRWNRSNCRMHTVRKWMCNSVESDHLTILIPKGMWRRWRHSA